MKIIVCIKQVPDTQKVKVDEKTGVLIREGIESKMNPFDLFGLETAIRIKERTAATIAVLTMGPPSAKSVLYEAFALGADEGYLMTDRRFAGADVLATSFTLSQGIRFIDENFDLIICGKQTTDGDTAQVGPAIAEYLKIPHVSWVTKLRKADQQMIAFQEDLLTDVAEARMAYPCLITVEKDIYQPRLPSYRLKKKTAKQEIRMITLDDLQEKDPNRYGLAGSPTQVERIFEPTGNHHVERIAYDDLTNAHKLYEQLVALKYVEGK
ncbi:Caffeyl-CoA reductase-Etf complex subunit CarD [bioreactor metagenome]|uniref:Caffeyl-CoA reductase-Etf complex subunit CarD n=1 Tax=bioreactor metagenome TaxID=1076179 RepID=A0A645ALD6_9ZZZZ